jgi:hypothetical protein
VHERKLYSWSRTGEQFFFPLGRVFSSGTHFCWTPSKPRGLVQPEGLGKLKKNSFTSSGIEPATFRLVAYCYATAYTVTADCILIWICEMNYIILWRRFKTICAWYSWGMAYDFVLNILWRRFKTICAWYSWGMAYDFVLSSSVGNLCYWKGTQKKVAEVNSVTAHTTDDYTSCWSLRAADNAST